MGLTSASHRADSQWTECGRDMGSHGTGSLLLLPHDAASGQISFGPPGLKVCLNVSAFRGRLSWLGTLYVTKYPRLEGFKGGNVWFHIHFMYGAGGPRSRYWQGSFWGLWGKDPSQAPSPRPFPLHVTVPRDLISSLYKNTRHIGFELPYHSHLNVICQDPAS